MYLSIPTKFNDESLALVDEINANCKNSIRHVYGSLSGLFSSRETQRLKSCNEFELERHIEELTKRNVEFYYCINGACIYGDRAISMHDFITKLYNLGVRNFIISNPELMTEVHTFKDTKIKASTIIDIDSLPKFLYFEKLCDSICLSTRANRNFLFLKQLEQYADKVELLANETCIWNCPNRQFHYIRESHDLPGDDPFVSICYAMMNDTELLKSRFIRPEDMYEYEKFCSIIKITGRTMSFDFIKSAALSYANEQTINDDLMSIFPIVVKSIENEQNGVREQRILRSSQLDGFLEHFKKNGHLCDFICGKGCSYCATYKKPIQIETIPKSECIYQEQ